MMMGILLRVLLLIRDEALALSGLEVLWPLSSHCELVGFVWCSIRSSSRLVFPSSLWTSLSETRTRINDSPRCRLVTSAPSFRDGGDVEQCLRRLMGHFFPQRSHEPSRMKTLKQDVCGWPTHTG